MWQTSLQRDPLTSYLLSLELNKRINYSTYVGTGVFNEEFLYEINYDENGKIYGRVNISETSSLVFENGMINEITGTIHALRSEYDNLKVYLTGGDSIFFEAHLKNGIFANQNLVLEGINKIIQINK